MFLAKLLEISDFVSNSECVVVFGRRISKVQQRFRRSWPTAIQNCILYDVWKAKWIFPL